MSFDRAISQAPFPLEYVLREIPKFPEGPSQVGNHFEPGDELCPTYPPFPIPDPCPWLKLALNDDRCGTGRHISIFPPPPPPLPFVEV